MIHDDTIIKLYIMDSIIVIVMYIGDLVVLF